MPLPRQYGSDNGMQSLYNLFRINPNAFPGVNPGAFSGVANDEIAEDTAIHKATSPEMQREQSILANADQRAEVGIRGDLAEAEAVRGARNLGYEGSHPLAEQQQHQERSALAKVLLPKQMELEAARENAQATREFTASENDQNRELRRDIAQGSQAGQNQRLTERAANTAASSVKAGRNPLRSIFGGHMGIDTNEQVQQREQQRVRDSVRAQMGTASSEQTVHMIAPNGEEADVPQSRVQEYIAKGATVAN